MNTCKIENKSVVFHTNGPIDPIAWEMLGVSAKQDGAIGQFGTGLSYAIAVLMRTGHEVSIKTDGEIYNFTTEPISFRGKNFNQILCNGKRMAYPTDYGKFWDVWMAYRELVSNTMDEDGLWFAGEAMDEGTSIVITGEPILECLNNHNDYFIGDREPVEESDTLSIYRGNGTVFHKGVKVGAAEGARYSYDIHIPIDLTEDRTIKYNFEVRNAVSRFYCKETTDVNLIREFINKNGASYESTTPPDSCWSKTFLEEVRKMWLESPTLLRQDVAQMLKEKEPSLQWEAMEPDDDQQIMIDAAISFLDKAGYRSDSQIAMVENMDSNNIAFVHQGRIFLTPKAFEKGLFNLCTVLLEEIHHCHGHDDMTRSYQTYLMGEIVTQAKKRLRIAL